MTSDEQQFNDAIAANPMDQATRLIYADWLDEQGRSDEADRQRQWVPAVTFLAEFTGERYNDENYDDDQRDRLPGPIKFRYSEVMAEIEYWKECVVKNGQPYRTRSGYDTIYDLCFSTNHAQDALYDEATRKEFWRHVEVITGVKAPPEIADQESYRCAC